LATKGVEDVDSVHTVSINDDFGVGGSLLS
jgi:hypothetical protein